MIVGQAVGLAIAGIVGGAACAALLTRLMTGFLFEIGPSDPATFLSVSGAILAVAVAASVIPGLRATRVDPVVALRAE